MGTSLTQPAFQLRDVLFFVALSPHTLFSDRFHHDKLVLPQVSSTFITNIVCFVPLKARLSGTVDEQGDA